MIPVFRKIRKQLADNNRPLKYLRYAFGEIVLVVIGILIALQINNWNQKRIQLRNINDALVEIHTNLISDYRSLDWQINYTTELIKKVSQLESDGEIMPIDTLIKKMTEIHAIIGWRPIIAGFNKLQQIKGNVSLPNGLLTKLTKSYHYFESPIANHNSNGLSLYSVNKYRDYLIKKGFPLLSPTLKNKIKNKNGVRALTKDIEFIGILRNFQYNLGINGKGFEDAHKTVERMIADLEAYFDQEKIAYKKFKK